MEPELAVKFKGDLTEWNAAISKAKSDLALLDSYMRKAAQANAISSRATAKSTTENNLLIASLNSLGRKLADNTAAANKNADALKRTSSDTDKLKQSTDKATIGIGGFIKGYLSVAAVMEGGRIFLDSTKQAQKFEAQLKTASGGQQDYAKNMQFLEGLAQKYNKNIVDLGANFAQLTIATKGTNLEGEKTERLFAAVTATSAALQMSVDDTNGTFRAFIQMVSKGNVQAEELRGQLGERLYGAFNMAAQSMGKTTQELNKMLENGEVLASDLLPKLTVELENTFGDVAVQNAQNLGNAIDYATGQLTLFLSEFAKGTGFTSWVTEQTKEVGLLAKQLRILGSVHGAQATVGGVLGSGLEDVLNEKSIYRFINKNGYKSPSLEYARSIQRMGDSITPFDSGDYVNSFPGQVRPKGFKLPGALLDQQIADAKNDPGAAARAEKEKKKAEAAARKADAAANKWVAEQIRQSNQRIADGLAEAKLAQAELYNNKQLGVTSIGNTGTKRVFGMDQDNAHTEFTNPTTGDGSANNYDHVIAGMDDAIKQIQVRYKRLQGVTDDFGTQLNDSITNALGTAIMSMAEGVGTLAAGLATGTADMGDVGNAFLGIMASLFDNIGKALAAHAATLILAKASISTMNIAGSLAGAALAFGAAAVARASIADSSQGAFWTGGIVPHKGGLDAFPIMATGGEMILNRSQQGRMFGILDGAMSGKHLSGGGRSNSERGELVGELRGVRVSSGDIGFSARVGEKKNNYFRSNSR